MLTVQIVRVPDLKNLCEVSKHVCEIATPRLYESLTLKAADFRKLEDLQHSIDYLPWKHLGYTKDIRIKSPFRTNLRRRCLHHSLQIADAGAEKGDDSDEAYDVGTHFGWNL
jgi:hypothetical protein